MSNVLEFDFGAMKAQLERERREVQDPRTSLTKLLSNYSHFMQDPDKLDSHYTIVQLEDLSDTHIDQLADREHLRKYILRNLPIDFSDDFPFKERIYDHIRQYIKRYNVVKINLESDLAPSEIVCRPSIPSLREPEIGVIYNAKDERIACYWACLYEGGGKIPEQYADYRGFVYKVKGFTIGDNLRLQDRFKKGNSALYWWYMGEIFVLDHSVIPNAARDDFEASSAKAQLEIRVKATLSNLEEIASNYQLQGRADTIIERSENQLQDIENKINSQRYDSYQLYSDLDKMIQALEAQRRNATDVQYADKLIQYAIKLQQIVSNKTDETPTSAKRRKKTPQKLSSPINLSLPQPFTENPENLENTKQTDSSSSTTISDTKSVRTLMQVFESTGWDLTDDCTRLIRVIDASFSDVLLHDSDIYQKLLDDIEAKLNNGPMNELEVGNV